jgi:hypothetical protein
MAQKKLNTQDVGKSVFEQGFIKCRFARAFFNKALKAANASSVRQLGWKWNTAKELDSLARRFRLPKEHKKVRLTLHVGFSAEMKTANVVLLGVFRSQVIQDSPAGCFVVTFSRDKKKVNIARISNVYLDRRVLNGHGYADALLKFLKLEIYPVMETVDEELKADFCGRYVWAKSGFQFVEKYWYKDSAQKKGTMKLWEMARKNFSRFLAEHSVDVKQLKFSRDGEDCRLKSVEQLETPADFASVVHIRGKKITLPVLMDQDVLAAPEPMDVGKAFMLRNYQPEGKAHVKSQGGAKFAVAAMPYFNAYRKVGS